MPTVMDFIGDLITHCVHKVEEVNEGKDLTAEEFAAAVIGTIKATFPRVMDHIEAEDPELAVRLRAAILAKYEALGGRDGE